MYKYDRALSPVILDQEIGELCEVLGIDHGTFSIVILRSSVSFTSDKVAFQIHLAEDKRNEPVAYGLYVVYEELYNRRSNNIRQYVLADCLNDMIKAIDGLTNIRTTAKVSDIYNEINSLHDSLERIEGFVAWLTDNDLPKTEPKKE